MSKRIFRTGRGVFAVLVAAGLTFGARAAVAGPDRPSLCPYDPGSGHIGQACVSNETCLEAYTQWWGSWNPGFCGDGCCICMI